MDIAKRIYELGIVPVVKLDSPDDALPLGKALLAGGLACAEITFRTDAAEESIRRICAGLPNMLVGAGTVVTTDQVDRALAAGAQFIVTPGFNPATVKYCIHKGVAVFPGCSNAGAIEQAMELGLTNLKFFPAEQSGGLPMIKALCGPFTKVKFMPTGGINEKNLNEYLAFDKILACGGSWMVKDSLIREGRFDEIERLTRKAVQDMLGFGIRHIGVNCENGEEAAQQAQRMCALLGMPFQESERSAFTGEAVEFMKVSGFGKNGHIAISTNNVDRAYAYLAARGYEFREETATYDSAGRRNTVYLKEEIGGFALHLAQK